MATMVWTEEQEDQLIAQVEKRQALWNITLQCYSSRQTKDRLWREIESELGIPGKEARRKWENLRTVYNRYKKPAPGATRTLRQQWIISRMSFIEPHTKRKESQSNPTQKEPAAAATLSESPTQGSSSESWNLPEDACLYEADSDANPSPHAAESTLCGAESTQTHTPLRDETQPAEAAAPSSSRRPPGPRPWGRRGRRALGKAGAEERMAGRRLERLVPQRGRVDAISAYCRSLELRMRQMPRHTLPYFQHEVDSCLFNYTMEHTLPPETEPEPDQGLRLRLRPQHRDHQLDHRDGERYDPKALAREPDGDPDSKRAAEPRRRGSERERWLELDAELERKWAELRWEAELQQKRAELRQEAELAQELEHTCRRLQELRRRREQRRRELQLEVCVLECSREDQRHRDHRGAATQSRGLRRRTLETDTQPLMDMDMEMEMGGREVEVELDC